MDRRETLARLAVLGLVPGSVMASTRDQAQRIGVLRAAPDDAPFRLNFDEFRLALRALGLVEGENIVFDHRVRPGNAAAIAANAEEIVRANASVILAIAAPGIRAASQATRRIPIVAIDLESDPVADGYTVSLARPSRNVTGLFLDFPELSGKWIELLRGAIPKLSRVALLFDPAVGPHLVKGAEQAATATTVTITRIQAHHAEELDSAFATAASQRVDAVLALSSPIFNSARKRIASLAARLRLPTIMPFPNFVDDGGLMAYGPHLVSMFRQAGVVTAKLLRGSKPMDIPIEKPTRFELAINLRMARQLGLQLAPTLLVRADRIVE